MPISPEYDAVQAIYQQLAPKVTAALDAMPGIKRVDSRAGEPVFHFTGDGIFVSVAVTFGGRREAETLWGKRKKTMAEAADSVIEEAKVWTEAERRFES